MSDDFFKGSFANTSDEPADSRQVARKPTRDDRQSLSRWKGALNSEQLHDLITVARKSPRRGLQHSIIIQLSATTGLRRSEILNLQVPDINFPMGFVTVAYKKEDDDVEEWMAKTKESYRSVPLDEDVARQLRDYLAEWSIADGYVFPPARAGSMHMQDGTVKKRYTANSYTNMLNTYALKTPSIGMKIGVHALRRTYGSLLLELDVPITDIQRLYGHRNLRTTLVYLKSVFTPKSDMRIRKAVSKIIKDEDNTFDTDPDDPAITDLSKKTTLLLKRNHPELFRF